MSFHIEKYAQNLHQYIPSRDIVNLILKDVFFLNLCSSGHIKNNHSFNNDEEEKMMYLNFSIYGSDEKNKKCIFHFREHEMLSNTKNVQDSWQNYCYWKSENLSDLTCKNFFFIIMKINYMDNILYAYPNKCWLTLEFLPHLQHENISDLAPLLKLTISKDFQICSFKKRKFYLKMLS
jgi:hypothetical protein